MLSVFAEISNFKNIEEAADPLGTRINGGRESWLLEKKVKISRRDEWLDGDLGDSCCFGTRTIQRGSETPWKLYGF